MIVSPITTVCPDTIRIANRQSRNRRREKSAKVKRAIREWCKGKMCTCGSDFNTKPCGRPATTAHHPKGYFYETEEAYLNLSECSAYHHMCHQNAHKGLVRCPTCTGWMKPGKYESCWICRGRPSGKRDPNTKPPRHPCAKRLRLQICADKKICPYSWQKAEEKCEHFVRRERK